MEAPIFMGWFKENDGHDMAGRCSQGLTRRQFRGEGHQAKRLMNHRTAAAGQG